MSRWWFLIIVIAGLIGLIALERVRTNPKERVSAASAKVAQTANVKITRNYNRIRLPHAVAPGRPGAGTVPPSEVQTPAAPPAPVEDVKPAEVQKTISDAATPPALSLTDPKVIMQLFISVVMLGVSLFVTLAKKFDVTQKQWAAGVIGSLIAFWLK